MAKPYISEATHFLTSLKKADATLEARQLEGRARLWDKQVTLQDLDIAAHNTVGNKSYVYQTNNDWLAQ